MNTLYHPARWTAGVIKAHCDYWFTRLTAEEHEAFATVQAALHRIADEDLNTPRPAKEA